MYLRSLTIRGFKSFARKTIMEFQPGVTIIVGPNGSGKSNIADAVMWVLGEQSPTSLRGNRMEDIIFSGSASIKPVNLAEVALTLDNSQNDFPLEYSEITVSRNVVRGGDSEYRLNSGSCRLLDIQELLSDAGVGRTLNSVISQGQLDEVLSCRPEERRDYIEEAGGLLKFRRRREKAVRRLSRMEEELVRTNDVMREVRRQLRPLQRQAGKLEKYQLLNRELAESKLRLDVARLRMMQREWQRHQDVQDERKKRLAALDRELADKTQAAGELEDRQSGWRSDEANLREGLYRLVSIHEQLKAMLTVWGERSKRAGASTNCVDPAALESAKSRNRELRERKDELERDSQRLRSEESELAARALELNRQLNQVTREAAALEARLEVMRSSEGGLGAAGPRLLEEKRSEVQLLTAERDRLENEAEKLRREADARREEAAVLETELEKGERGRIEIFEELRRLEREEAGLDSTLTLLTQLETNNWDVINTAGILKNDKRLGAILSGTLAENLKIQPGHETAIMSLLGPWAFGFAAGDGETIKSAIQHLKRHELGQSLFFRSSDAGEVVQARTQSEPVPDGARRARDVVQAPECFDEALAVLLDGVFLADDLDSAFDLASSYPHLHFLCPDGDVISGGALVKGGSSTVNPVHLELTKDRREKMEESLEKCRGRIEALELELEAADMRAESAAEKLRAARRSFDDAVAAAARGSESLAACIERITAVEGEIQKLSEPSRGEGDTTDIAELEGRLEGLREQGSKISDRLWDAECAREEAAGSVLSTASELASLERRLEAGEEEERRMRSYGPEKVSESGESGKGTFPADADTEDLLKRHRRLIDLVSALREKVRRDIDEGALSAEEDARTLRTLREEIGRLQDQHEGLRDLLHDEELSRAELKVKVEQLVEGIIDGHKVPLEFALKQYPDEEPSAELEEKVERLALELEHIGPVNPEAITEREALEQRFDFLRTQVDDIEESKKQLRKVVRQVDREIENKFTETLDAVNGHFKDIFSTLFPNGQAELRMTDPEDLLNTGVEILAQPEGKRLRRISLLSGGETSLTALAFFFALFRVRPSPFYFLDEVEAALDDVNLHRFLDLVKQFKDESQLILITHQKRSMEIADILYGVTMQDDGVSKVVSQKVAS